MNTRISLLFLSITLLLLAACSPRPEVIAESVQLTLEAMPTDPPAEEVAQVEEPTAAPEPTEAPTDVPEEPTAEPEAPTEAPTATLEPTEEPTEVPTEEPTAEEVAPTEEPTEEPTPTLAPTEEPTVEPTAAPTDAPTDTPTAEPTSTPEPTATATAEPTNTPTPEPTPEPTFVVATPELSDPIFLDFFVDGGFWDLSETASSSVVVEDGQFKYIQKDPNTFSLRLKAKTAQDFFVQVKADVEATCGFEDKIGIAFRVQNSSNYYAFVIDCTRKFRVMKVENGNVNWLTDWTFSRHIRYPVNRQHALGVEAKGSNFTFYIDGIEVYSMQDDAFASGQFGLWVGSRVTRNLTVRYSEMEAYLLP